MGPAWLYASIVGTTLFTASMPPELATLFDEPPPPPPARKIIARSHRARPPRT